MIEIVSATRLSESEFWARSALGRSIIRSSQVAKIQVNIAFENQRGLPEVYNASLDSSQGQDVVVFVHDDVWIEDAFFATRVVEGLRHFNVLGVAGNRRRVIKQTGWAFLNETLTWDDRENLSGALGHGQDPFSAITVFGKTPAPCELIDGVFIATRKSTLLGAKVRFDPQFEFHFYDMDFSRQARQAGLSLATWLISVTHQSGGSFGSPGWTAMLQRYREKWGD